MDQETVQYLIRYFRNLMTEDEKLALHYHMYTYTSDSPDLRNMMIKKGWINNDPEITNYLKNGYEEFELNVARRMMNESSDKVFFNTCPKCNKLARTPRAKQCRYCRYSWHYLVVAKFKINNVFQITGKKFFLIGQIIEGEIKRGQKMDLTPLGLNKKPAIESIEFALTRKDGRSWEDIALGTKALTEDQKLYLKKMGSFADPIDIICGESFKD